jgi:hypothetical protein
MTVLIESISGSIDSILALNALSAIQLRKEKPHVPSVSRVWRLTIELRNVAPRVWRTILVRPDTKLHLLHAYLAGAMGWEDRHLFAFEINGREYLIPDLEYSSRRKTFDVRRYTLERVCPALPCALTYTYDFADEWIHDVTVESEEAAAYRKQYPICVDGAGNCPPEDCGGPHAFGEQSGDREVRQRQRPFSVQIVTWTRRDIQRGYR